MNQLQQVRPPELTAIRDARPREKATCIGFWFEDTGAYWTPSGWEIRFYIYDGVTEPQFERRSSMRCVVCRPDLQALPKGLPGDLVLVRSINVGESSSPRNALMGYSTRNAGTQILIFRTNNIPAPEFSAAYGPGGQSTLVFRGLASNPTPKEQLAIINLNALAKDSPAMSLWTKKDRLIKDIEVGTYCNLAVEIVKIYDTGGDSVDLYVTDYTTNKDLYLYEDPKYADRWSSGNVSRWNGPYGQVTLAVRAWEPHTRVARSVQVGDVVMLTNVHIKMSRELKVEGALHQDQRFPDKVQITKIYNRDQITALNRRKEDFYNARSRPPANPPRKSGTKRAAKKKEEKKAREREEKEAEQRRIEKHLEEEAAKRGNINAYIRVPVSSKEIKLSTCNDILYNPTRRTKDGFDLPFVNAKYKAQLRVVDFSPNSLNDFCHCMSDSKWNPSAVFHDRRRNDEWQWGFVLLVEDANPPRDEQPVRFPLFVCNDSGKKLLKMDAFDPNNDIRGRNMTKLEEKLFILWGNLLELKKELVPKGISFPLDPGNKLLQNKAFECCIDEYGAKVPSSPRWPTGWQRMYKLTSTVIED